MTNANEPILDVRGLRVTFETARGAVTAVDGIDLAIHAGERIAIIGESGCGKSTTARAIARLLKPDSGSIFFRGRDLARLDGRALREARRGLQMVFQDPDGSLDPRWTAGQSVEEPMASADAATRRERAQDLLQKTGLAREYYDRYPHELSGGQKQRVAIARAMAAEPDCVLLDEPTSALDVSVRAQIVELLLDISGRKRVAMCLITHDFAVARAFATRLMVMHAGSIVEEGATLRVLTDPEHPATRALVDAVAVPDPEIQRKKLESHAARGAAG
jgi:ABC-type oligopeptide transport system ATPase subunit